MSRSLRMTEEDLRAFVARAQRLQKDIDWITERAGRKPSADRALRMMRIRQRQEEHAQLVMAIIVRLKYDGRVGWLVRQNTGTFLSLDGKRRVRCGWKGQLDILGQLANGRMLAIDAKTGDSRPTKDQRATIDTINKHGGLAFCARSVQQAVNEIDSFMRRLIIPPPKERTAPALFSPAKWRTP